MIKGYPLEKGDKIAIVSLSRGVLGENECKHNLEIGIKRLKEFGLNPVFMENALKGLDFIEKNPELRAEDLKNAFRDDSIKGILCAIGGIDTYRTLPYLLEDDEFIKLVKENPKIFIGFSDSTTNHLMFYKLGLTTYYGMSFLADIADIGNDMVPYSKKSFNGLFNGNITKEIISSEWWYDERSDFSLSAVGTDRIKHNELRGYELIQGDKSFTGKLLGGCVETIMDGLTQEGIKEIYEKYGIFPRKEEWLGKILFLETSEDRTKPEKLREILIELKKRGVFDSINGILVGKPQNEVYYEEYKKVYLEVLDNKKLPIVYNVNFGHSIPRCILPYGIEVEVDIINKKIIFLESMLKKKN